MQLQICCLARNSEFITVIVCFLQIHKLLSIHLVKQKPEWLLQKVQIPKRSQSLYILGLEKSLKCIILICLCTSPLITLHTQPLIIFFQFKAVALGEYSTIKRSLVFSPQLWQKTIDGLISNLPQNFHFSENSQNIIIFIILQFNLSSSFSKCKNLTSFREFVWTVNKRWEMRFPQ